jgi:hypothetical protein
MSFETWQQENKTQQPITGFEAWKQENQEIAPVEMPDDQSFVQQFLGTQAKSWMRIGSAVTGVPKHLASWAETGYLSGVLMASKLFGDDVEETAKKLKFFESAFEPTKKVLDIPIKEHRRGVQSIIKAHPEWEYDPPENVKDLITSPRKLALAVSESLPLLASAGIMTVAGAPQTSLGMMFTAEGEEAYQQALADGATEAQAEKAYVLYGSVAAAIEQLQLQQFLKLGKGAYKQVLNTIAKKVGSKGWKAVSMQTLKNMAAEAVEEMSQGTWQEVTAKLTYGKEFSDIGSFIDRRLQEGVIAGTMAMLTGVGGATVAQMKTQTQDPEVTIPLLPEAGEQFLAEDKLATKIEEAKPIEEASRELKRDELRKSWRSCTAVRIRRREIFIFSFYGQIKRCFTQSCL